MIESTDLWNEAYNRMLKKVQAAKNVPNEFITPEVVDLIGTSPPKILSMTSQKIQSMLESNDLDIGMCGYLITLERLEMFDFVNPFHYPSGFQAVISKPTVQPSVWMVLMGLLGCIDGKAQLIILLLLVLIFIFGHLSAAAELFATSSLFRSGYLEATQDGMWLAAAVFSTVGFGDLVPRGAAGRAVTTVWIFLSVSLTTMLLAVITANFFRLQLVPDDPRYSIAGVGDLGAFSIATAVASAVTDIQRVLPAANVTKFPTNTQPAVFAALLAGAFDVAVDRPESAQCPPPPSPQHALNSP